MSTDKKHGADGADSSEPRATTESEGVSRISIAGDAVMTALSRLVAGGDLDEPGKAAIWWFFGHARDKGMSLEDAGKCIDRDATTVHRLFNGRYGAAYTNLVADIVRYRALAEERAKRKNIGFIETTTWRKINIACKRALFDNMASYIYGSSQIGKTACLEEYARRNNHGQTRYMRMPSAPTYRKVLRMVAASCYLSHRLSIEEIERRIYNAIGTGTLLVFDEFHQAFIGCSDMTARKIVEFIRELYDRTHCGIVICGTKVVQDEFENGRQKLVWDQFRRRGMLHLVLPDTPPRADIQIIAEAFGLADPNAATLEIIREMLAHSGVGMYFKFLQLAHGVAVSRGEKLTWDHFSQAYKNIQALSR